MKNDKMKTKYTFWELLSKYKIEIPKIQRDYAQGRKEPEIINIVDVFLEDIKNSIINSEELNLDFVYGKVEDSILIPLDGQQRLTTLFLIHWYIALKEDKLTKVKSTLSKFTYETRVSSEDFCKNLISESIDYNSINEKISDIITDSKWYFLSWELDPTVSAMLNMLDIIHNKFKDIEEQLFEKLESKINISGINISGINITFQFLPLEQFKLTDELYIKMNARGKPLTEFENFKANFSQYLTIEDKSKLDNEWLDIFWNFEKNKNSEIVTDNVDKQFFNFFKNITLNFYVEKNDIDRDFFDNYNLFNVYEDVFSNTNNVNNLKNILDGLISYEDNLNIFFLFSHNNISYAERLHFYALSFVLTKKITDKSICNRWLRITKNLINNTRIEEAVPFMNALRSIKELSENISDIYTFVSSNNNIKHFLKLQIEEESLKSKLIIENEDWETLFVEIEQHSYFDGQIGFVLQYSKNDEGEYEKKIFENYSLKLSKLFGNEFSDFLFQRALLTKGNYLVDTGLNKTFCLFDKALRTKNDNWRKVFNDEQKTLYLKELLDEIDYSNIKLSLEKVINNHQIDDWRKLIIKNPSNIAYCRDREIRYSNDTIYLLSQRQMNSWHKEIYSWDLFLREFKQTDDKPFDSTSYRESKTSSDEPCIVISGFNYKSSRIAIEITYNNDNYNIYFNCKDDESSESIKEYSKPIKELLRKLNFENNRITLEESELDEKIKNICSELKRITE